MGCNWMKCTSGYIIYCKIKKKLKVARENFVMFAEKNGRKLMEELMEILSICLVLIR